MEPSIYSYSLCIALPLMLFFGFLFLLAPTSEKAIFNNYLRSRRIMGVAILLLCRQLFGTFLFGIGFKNTDAAIPMNLSTYFCATGCSVRVPPPLCLTAFISPNVGYGRISVYGYCFPSFPASFCCCYQKVVYRQR